MTRLLALGLCLPLFACGPRIYVKREQPARADLGPDARVLAVHNAHHESVLGVVLDPLGALARTVLTPHAVREVERSLSTSERYQVLPGCGEGCRAADTHVEVSVTSARIEPGDAKTSRSKDAAATVSIRVFKNSGALVWQHDYRGSDSGGVPGSKYEVAENTLLVRCVDKAVEAFVRDLHPQWLYESFRMEDEGPLEPCAKLAVQGDLDGAEAIARQVLAADPENARAIYNLGALFTARGQLEPALDAFRAAAKRDPKYAGYARGAEQRLRDRGVLQDQPR